ncbi:tetratricopeptide repeat protein [Enterococcus casseliflavus]|uniref:tetratricopeptide repeat protein n=1 Tax=Enterococcus casseliflavus TaxID=37734 RepID=UPI0021C8D97C|nr:tetratricopeptide repeat protein [Enterococcus casseliflavus]
MNERLAAAIQLRTEKKLQQSNEQLIQLAAENPQDAFVHYQTAWSYDLLGEEQQAIPYYEQAISLGLSENDLPDAYLGLGSTYRALGNYQKAEEVFLEAMKQYLKNHALQTFYAMTLFNLAEYEQATKRLLTLLAETSNDPDIQSYRQALLFYADKLNETWA